MGDWIIENPENISSAEIVVGIPSRNEADSIAFPTEQSSLGLTTYFKGKKAVIVNCDNFSTDGTKDAFFSAPCEVPRMYLSTPEGVAGKGKVVMLEFWATWCDICKSEMPVLVDEYNKFKDKGYEILAITLSRGDPKDRSKIQELKDKYGLEYPILLDTEYKVATKIYGLSGPIPLKVIIDCGGKIRYSHVGDFPDGISEVPFVLEDLLQDSACGK